MVKGQCFKCKQQREIKDIKYEVNKIGRAVARGVCPVCGTSMYKMLAKDEVPADLAAKVAKFKKGGVTGGGKKSRKSRKSGKKSKKSKKSRKSTKSKKSRKSKRSRR
jgi:hypothetical protein